MLVSSLKTLYQPAMFEILQDFYIENLVQRYVFIAFHKNYHKLIP